MKKNIYWLKNANQWMVRIKGHYLGMFNEFEQAKKVLDDFKKANPTEKKHIITASVTSGQLTKFRKLGSQRWLRDLLDK